MDVFLGLGLGIFVEVVLIFIALYIQPTRREADKGE